MMNHPTLEKLTELRLGGMKEALCEQQDMPDIEELDFEERLGLLVDRELTARDDRRLKTRLRTARLRQQAAIEDLDYRHPRGLDKSLMRDLASCQWGGCPGPCLPLCLQGRPAILPPLFSRERSVLTRSRSG